LSDIVNLRKGGGTAKKRDEKDSFHPEPYSLEKDRAVKLPIYAEHRIPEVIIINLKEEQTEHYYQPVDGLYEMKQVLSFGAFIGEGMLKGQVLPIS